MNHHKHYEEELKHYMRSEIPLQENCVLDSAEKWMLKGKLWMLTTI